MTENDIFLQQGYRATSALLLCLVAPHLAAGTWHLAPNTAIAGAKEPAVLFLDIEVNGQAAGKLVQVFQHGTDFDIEADTLRGMHVHSPQPRGSHVRVNELPGVTVAYDALNQRLQITVPPEWLPVQRLSDEAPEESAVGAMGTGWLMNYDFYSSHSRQQSLASLWTEQRYFSPQGVGFNTGLARLIGRGDQSGYVRYDTRWTRTDTAHATETLYGDIVTGALPWTSAVRLGGVQWARNFGVRPDLVTYPMPEFSGIAAVPSAVDLFVNGFRASRHQVAPGPFTLGEMPVVNGAGTASVVTTDALGREVMTSIPFYVNRELLRPGWTDYSLSLGALRRNYGQRSFAYGKPVATGIFRTGLSETLTLEAQAQWGKGLRVAGAGGLATLGLLGIANASLTSGYTQRSGSGWQYSAGWQYSTPGMGVSVQQTARNARFGDASTYADDGYVLPRRTRQVNLSWSAGKGAISAGWLDQRNTHNQRNRIAFASYTAPLRHNTYLSFTAGRTVETGETQIRLQLTYLLGNDSTAQLAASRSRDSTRTYASYQRNMPTEGGWGWNASHAPSGGVERYSQAALQYRNDTLSALAGISSNAGQSSQWLGMAGSLGTMDGHVFAANRIHDSFALVSTQGMPNVPVMYENQPVGQTNAKGYLLVPSVTAFYPGRYAINPLSLPADVDIPTLERRITASRGAGMLVNLPVLKMHTATIVMVDEQGKNLPAGSAVLHGPADIHTVVGWDGVVYLTKLQPRNHLSVRTTDGVTCNGEFSQSDYAATRDLVVKCVKSQQPQARKGEPSR